MIEKEIEELFQKREEILKSIEEITNELEIRYINIVNHSALDDALYTKLAQLLTLKENEPWSVAVEDMLGYRYQNLMSESGKYITLGNVKIDEYTIGCSSIILSFYEFNNITYQLKPCFDTDKYPYLKAFMDLVINDRIKKGKKLSSSEELDILYNSFVSLYDFENNCYKRKRK